jgi:phenylacetate-CoA ligase
VLAWSARDLRTPFLAAEKVHALRDARLRALVRHAAAHVAHYRELFRERGIDPREIATADDLAALPLLEKEAVQLAPERFRSTAPDGRRALPFRSTGSSGTPLLVFHEPSALLKYLSAGVRQDHVLRRLLGLRRGRTLTLAHPTSTGPHARAFYRRATLLPRRPARKGRLSPEAPVATIVETVNARRPDVLAGGGSSIELLFRLAAAGDVSLHRPRLVKYQSDAMSEEGRRLIEESFGIPVLSSYAAVETFRIGFFCERRTGHHLHEDCCHVRVVRPDGSDASPGEPGEVVVSNLLNRGTVLLNYRLGDVAALLPDACPCGRSFRLLGVVEGRVIDFVRLDDGTRVHPWSVGHAVRVDGLLRFQLIQEERTRFRLEVVTTGDEAYARVVERAAANLRAVLGGAEVSVVRREALDETGSRKFRRVIPLPD